MEMFHLRYFVAVAVELNFATAVRPTHTATSSQSQRAATSGGLLCACLRKLTSATLVLNRQHDHPNEYQRRDNRPDQGRAAESGCLHVHDPFARVRGAVAPEHDAERHQIRQRGQERQEGRDAGDDPPAAPVPKQDGQ